jgi:ribonuclease BN (tRNA processing enzyme)
MKLTIVGSGDAFGSGGRSNTCFWLETAKSTLVVDFGASALPALKALKLDPNRIDAIVLSHLHGDHFGGLPFLLLDGQFLSRRETPLLIVGPPGTRARLEAALEIFFPKSTGSKWRFSWRVEEIAPGVQADVLGHTLVTAEVIHQSGAPSTALRLSDGKKTFAYSGDTEWTEALLAIAKDADLFMCECYAYAGTKISGHMSWEILQARLADLGARRTMITHMNPTMLARAEEIEAGGGVLVAADGLTMVF